MRREQAWQIKKKDVADSIFSLKKRAGSSASEAIAALDKRCAIIYDDHMTRVILTYIFLQADAG